MDARRALIVAAGATGALLSAAAPATADTKVNVTGGAMYVRNDDPGIANDLTIEPAADGRIRLADDADPYGFQWTPPQQCDPGRLNNAGNPVEVTCSRNGVGRLVLELGPGEDRTAYALDDLAVTMAGLEGADALNGAARGDALNGGQGNDALDGRAGDDTLNGEDGDDRLVGGDGNDRLNGGAGGDQLEAGAGEDEILAADGVQDTIDCGPGADRVNADSTDRLVNCETEQRQEVAAPPAGSPAQRGPEDDVRPVLQAGGLSSQRISPRRRRITIAVSVSERALVNVGGFLDARGTNDKVRGTATAVLVPGGGTYVTVTLSATQVRRALADLRRRRRPRLRLTISAVDPAGNTSPPRRLTIALRR
jgi:hypothetical protein